ncbi:hypothetical protein ANCCAN_26874 [Ancylostoma caninum]|uniref:Uncharacterized protein n=1 Tax=Ancylostoma caninum TaxID=29170 RepID=A0A368F5I8_ANCCA|nr:hypothetical protein ANCCAN_26874 [Ancylostoma caninum]
MESERGIQNQGFFDSERLPEQNRFDKSNSGSVSARKTSLVRSLRKESRTKQPPPEELEMKLQSSAGSRPGTSISNETLTTSCDYGSSYQSPSFASSSRSPFLLPSNLSSYDVPKKKSSYAFETEHAEEMPHSRSWAGPTQSRNRLNQSSPSAYAFAIHPTQSDASASQSSSRKSRTPLLTPSSSYDNQRRSRVSQV